MEQKYITDEHGNRVLPITHVNAVRDSEGNTLTTLLAGKEEASEVAECVEELSSALYEEMGKDPDMKYGQPRILWGNGTPAEGTVPDNWKQLADGGYNWIGKPAFVGQLYVNTAVTSGGLYMGYKTSGSLLEWRTILA